MPLVPANFDPATGIIYTAYPVHMLVSEHPLVVYGNRNPLYFYEKDGAYYGRVDLPGITTDAIRVWSDGQFIFFEGADNMDDPEFDAESPRMFRGKLSLFPGRVNYLTDQLSYIVKDGVLKIKVPTRDMQAASP